MLFFQCSVANSNYVSGMGALLAIAAIKAKSFGGFCACIFIIGNGLGSLETAANPYITGDYSLNFTQVQESMH